jgi:integrase/recombinase XerD
MLATRGDTAGALDLAEQLAAALLRERRPSPTVAVAVERFFAALAVGRSPATVATYRVGLRRFAEFLAVEGLPPATTETAALPGDLAERFAVALAERLPGRRHTLFAYTTAVSTFLKFLYRRRWGPAESSYELTRLALSEVRGRLEYRMRRIDRRLPELVGHVLALPLPATLSDPGAYCRDSAERGLEARRLELLRDRALIATLWCTGARVAEVVSLDRADLDDGRIDQALITGKGRKERVLFFDERTLESIRAYLAAREDRQPPLFIRHNRGTYGAADGRLEGQSAWLCVKRHAAALGIAATPHHFRHAFACRLLNNGARMSEVSALLGHSSLAVTSKIYAKHDTRHLREVFDRHGGGSVA